MVLREGLIEEFLLSRAEETGCLKEVVYAWADEFTYGTTLDTQSNLVLFQQKNPPNLLSFTIALFVFDLLFLESMR